VNRNKRWGVNHIDDILRIVGSPSNIKTVFDVGANVGGIAIKYAKCFPNSTVYAFEPVCETFMILSEATKFCPRINSIQLALGDVSGFSNCLINADSGKNTLIDGLSDHLHANPIGSQLVKVSTLDTFAKENQIESIDLVKIDTEGFDLAVLQGAVSKLNAQLITFIYVEFHQLLRRTKATQLGSLVEIAEFLEKYNYRFIATYTDSVHGAEPLGTYNALFISENSGYTWLY
jgi:FkbM family methyltransferase